ncbi:YadA domain-containing protein [uncultured Mycobacterium sp.]|uniref:YadA domain-containing protein n=1 Tax=uncultured Mycobacterium sp. TaxID=171292 RepID=A0A1Y5PIZ2_9MYCO|nr:YadA domain-containing protein [uncultured Mycobacterium sp.]
MSVIANKLQATAGAAVLAAGLAITPAVAHAAPGLAPFSASGLGNSAELLVDPVVIVAPSSNEAVATPGSNKKAAANATPPAQVIQIFISGFVDAAQNAVKAGVQYIGTFVYGGLAFTGLAFNLVGQVLPGPIGDAFTNVGNGFDNAATNVAKAIKIGPYSTSA